MTAFIIWILTYLRSLGRKITLKGFASALFLITMMGSMLDALIYYIVAPPSFLNTIIAVNISMIIMTVAVVYILVAATIESYSSFTGLEVFIFAILLSWNEISMALFLRIIGFGFGGIESLGSYLSYFSLSITSILFLAPMLAEMIFFIFLRMPPGFEKRAVVTIFLMQIADPAMLGNSPFVLPLLAAYAIFMILAIYYLFSYVYAHRNDIVSGQRRIVRWIILLIVISAVGLLEPVIYPHPFGLSWMVFALSMMIAMTLYFCMILGLFHEKEPENVHD
ncbi:MAG: hypothetical protein ACP5OC_05855 [Thermoplasmata archaeon]